MAAPTVPPRRFRLAVTCKQRHFTRPSLHRRGLSDPSDVVQHVLTLFRRAHVPDLLPYLACTPDQPTNAVLLGSKEVHEQGPLAGLSGVLDVGARRVLPGHLLRRSRVLSTLRLGASFQQRIALAACTGEESVFEWSLQQVASSGDWSSDEQEQEQEEEEEKGAGPRQLGTGAGALALGEVAAAGQEPGQLTAALCGGAAAGGSEGVASGGAAAGGGGSRWVVATVRRDGSCDSPLPTTPHPKAAPEAVVKAQLAALARGDVFGASCFNIWRSHTSGFGLGIHYELLRDKLREPPYALLLGHAEALLGAGALPSQRVMLQEVAVLGSRGGGAGAGGSARFLWRLGMQANGCWQVTGIEVIEVF